MKKVILLGGKGLLGTNIAPILRETFDLSIVDVDTWDITDAESGRRNLSINEPDVVINLAAITDVDGCEDNKERAERVNAYGAGLAARICNEQHVRFVHISTDYVFDGKKTLPYKEDDSPNPTSIYGETKLNGERLVMENHPQSLIVRAQWLYGKGGSNFITKVVDAAKNGSTLRIVNDQKGSPTYTKDLAEPLIRLIEQEKSGIYHVANSGSCTWYEFAVEAFRLLNMNVEIIPISSDELERKAKRPGYSVFDMWKLQKKAGIRMRPWQEALQEYIGSIEAHG